MAGLELAHAGHHRRWSGHVVQAEITIKGVQIHAAFQFAVDQDALHLRREADVATVLPKIERLDPDTIARQHQPAIRFTPQSDGKHAAKPRKTIRVPLAKGVEYHFRVASRSKVIAARVKLGAQLLVIVNLAVQNHDQRSVFAGHRLPAGLKVDDPQPDTAQRYVRGGIYALLIRSPMGKLA